MRNHLPRAYFQCAVRSALAAVSVIVIGSTGPATRAQTNYQQLWSFGGVLGQNPYTPLVEGTDGNLYGLASGGIDTGVVFRFTRQGAGYVVLHNFTSGPDGATPRGLMEGSDGVLYGTTAGGGTNYDGTVFRINKDGSGYEIIHNFVGAPLDGRLPYAGVMEGTNGMLFGTTNSGGTNENGTIFRVNKDGTDYAVLKSFGGTNDGANPSVGVAQGNDGTLYGTTSGGGSQGGGVIYRLNLDGSGYTVLHNFNEDPTDGYSPQGCPLAERDGFLYGTALNGGSVNDGGVVYTISTNGSNYRILHVFTGQAGDGASPWGDLVEATNGAICGTTYYGGNLNFGSVFAVNKDGSDYRILWSFCSFGSADGAAPLAGLLQSRDGSLYGTTSEGGTSDFGSIFRLSDYIPPPRIETISVPGRTAFLSCTGGAAGRTYSILASPSIDSPGAWQGIGVETAAINGSFRFDDTMASNYPVRYYRVRCP